MCDIQQHFEQTYYKSNTAVKEQDRQRNYNVTLGRVCATTVAVEKQ